MGRLDTTYIFPNTNFIVGMGSAINLAGNYYTFQASATPMEADLRALQSDWLVIGQDIRSTMRSQEVSALACQPTN